MSPKKQAAPLNFLCVKQLSNQLIHALSDDEGKHFDAVKRYMFSATHDTLQSLLNEILGTINLDASIRFSCLEVLLREDVKSLDVGIFPRFYYEKILATIGDQGKRLQHLNLKGVWARDYPHLLSRLVANLTNLKSLLMPHMADDFLISSLGNLKCLVKLDMSGEACYTANGIRLLKSSTVRYLDIGSFGKPQLCSDSSLGYELIATILENLPNLNVLKTYSFTGHAILHLLKTDDNFKTKLTYLHDTATDIEVLEAIVKACPLLESAHINCPEEQVVERINEVKRLHSLKLTKGDGNELKTFLATHGTLLQLLQLNHNRNDRLDLSEICENASELLTLECYQMSLKFGNPNAFFMNLQKIQLLYCDITDEIVKTVMMNTPFLRSITIGCAINMTDGDIFRLLAECTLENLEELVFSEAHCLTVISVEILAENCPKLKILGSLTGWDIHQDELAALRILVSLSNIDLTFWPL